MAIEIVPIIMLAVTFFVVGWGARDVYVDWQSDREAQMKVKTFRSDFVQNSNVKVIHDGDS